MFDPPIEIAYRTTVEVPRESRTGSGLRWLGNHPVLGGLICGLSVVAIAAIRRPQGVAAEPLTAGIISALVIVTWMVLFFLMRRFFTAQSYAAQTVLRKIIIDEDHGKWLQNDEPLSEVKSPTVTLVTNPVPEGIGEAEKGSRKKATAWPIWIFIEGDEDKRIVFETRDAARRARDYDEVTHDIIDDTDERLPRAIAAPILQRLEDRYGAPE